MKIEQSNVDIAPDKEDRKLLCVEERSIEIMSSYIVITVLQFSSCFGFQMSESPRYRVSGEFRLSHEY